MNVTKEITRTYENMSARTLGENEPKTNPILPLQSLWRVNSISPVFMEGQFRTVPRTPPFFTQKFQNFPKFRPIFPQFSNVFASFPTFSTPICVSCAIGIGRAFCLPILPNPYNPTPFFPAILSCNSGIFHRNHSPQLIIIQSLFIL